MRKVTSAVVTLMAETPKLIELMTEIILTRFFLYRMLVPQNGLPLKTLILIQRQ